MVLPAPELIVHVGLAKAGSKTIQLSLIRNKSELLSADGIWYSPGSAEFFHDQEFFSHVMREEVDQISAYIEERRAAAVAARATRIVISSEDLMIVPGNAGPFRVLLSALRAYCGRVSFIVVVRELQDLVRSHIRQLILNGGPLPEDGRLASWIVYMVRGYWTSGVPCRAVSLEQTRGARGLFNGFVESITGVPHAFVDAHENKTPNRSSVFYAATGHITRLSASISGRHLSSPPMQQLNEQLSDSYDGFFKAAAHPESAKLFLQWLEGELDDKIEQYVGRTIELLEPGNLEFYAGLVSQKFTLSAGGSSVPV